MEQKEGQASRELVGMENGEDQSAYVWRGLRRWGAWDGAPTLDWSEGPLGSRPELRGEEALHDLPSDHNPSLVFQLLRFQEWLPAKHLWLPLLDKL